MATTYPSIRIEGGLLAPDVFDQLVAGDLPGQRPADFGLEAKRNLTDEIAALFADARALWQVFQHRLQRLPADDPATSVTRDAWVIPLLGLLGYELRYNPRAFDVDGLTFAISHRAGEPEDAPPIHIVGARQELGRVAASGRPRLAPHSLVQEYLNHTEHTWGVVTNGLTLRLLRDCTFVRRQAYIEFDLAAMFEEQRFADFVVLYRLLHRTRLPRGIADAEDCYLEQHYVHSLEQGGRVREHLREGVEECITRLANGFLRHAANDELRRRASPACSGNERITADDLYRQLLRLVYRFLFLLVSEDRGLLSPDPIYREHYGIARLRRLLDSRAAYTEHDDLWQSLRVLWKVLGDDKLTVFLQLAPLNGELFAHQALDGYAISNKDLLEAFWYLAWYQENSGSPARRVNYAALDVEELGSVYESLLEFHPAVDQDSAGRLSFVLILGSERKTTGSYYTPPELVAELVQSALEPVIRERLAARPNEREKALLAIRVCDPACGSGHFLLAAARRLGKELACVRTGEDEPAPERVREAVRDVISHSIYGVDKNPLAVDLCRVALWLESHTGGKPLTFLDHRIRCGDSLVGIFDLATLQDGIPDEAFKPREGDDRELARDLTKQNREERAGQMGLFASNAAPSLTDLTRTTRELDSIADDSPEAIRRKKHLFDLAHSDPTWIGQKYVCDLFTAAFFQPMQSSALAITSGALAEHLEGRPIDSRLLSQADVLSFRERFFHWPIEFPDVFADGGFDVVLSNPPWERVKLQEQEFFAARDAMIANAPNKAARAKLIKMLPESDPELNREFVEALRAAGGVSAILRHGGRFPLTGRGDINTYAVFAELCRELIRPNGRSGIIVPSGLATDNTTKTFFSDLISAQALDSFFEFENEGFFLGAGQGHMLRFALTTIVGGGVRVKESRFLFQGKRLAELADKDRVFTLSPSDIALVNPNTRTCPIFRSGYDAQLTKKIYSRVPVLIRDAEGDDGEQNPWGISFMRMFDMANDSHLFRTKRSLEEVGFCLEGNRFRKNGECFVPLYEAKMVYHYNHRHGDFRDAPNGERAHVLPAIPVERLRDPNYRPLPFYWVPEEVVNRALQEHDWPSGWLLGWRDVTDARASVRTLNAAVIPVAGASDGFLLMFPKTAADRSAALLGNLSAIVCDFVTRQKVGGLHLKYFTMKQLPVLAPNTYRATDLAFIVPRILELTYTSRDLEPWARDLGFDGPPFVFDPDRRALLRAELDGYYARLYGLSRDELCFILDPQLLKPGYPSETFSVLKRSEEKEFGHYRTKDLVLEAYDSLRSATEPGQPVQPDLPPPPGSRA